MVTLDDRLLGEKIQNYCSSSEDEDDKGKLVDLLRMMHCTRLFRQRFGRWRSKGKINNEIYSRSGRGETKFIEWFHRQG